MKATIRRLVFLFGVFSCLPGMASDLEFKSPPVFSLWMPYGFIGLTVLLAALVLWHKKRSRKTKAVTDELVVTASKRLNTKLSASVISYQQKK